MNGPIIKLDAEEISNEVTNSLRGLQKSSQKYDCFSDFLVFSSNWFLSSPEGPSIQNNPGCLDIATKLRSELDEFKQYLPLIQALRAKGVRERHWDELEKVCL